MIKRKLFSLVISTLLGAIGSLHAETVSIEATEHHLIHKVVENHGYCVSAFEGDKIFIRPENIVPTQQGFFINLNGSEFSPLPLLQFNKNGHFIEGSFSHGIELAAAKKGKTKGPCPNCDVKTDGNGVCTNSLCFFYGLKVL